MSNRPHLDWQGNEVEIPWPYLTQGAAARRLGVAVEYLTGMANNPVPAVCTVTDKGNRMWLFQLEAIEQIERRLTERITTM